jgi:hypothetical protein
MQAEVKHLTMADLEAGLDEILKSPKDQGVLDLIVSRPEEDAREVKSLADLDVAVGLVGDTWQDRPSARSGDGKALGMGRRVLLRERRTQPGTLDGDCRDFWLR